MSGGMSREKRKECRDERARDESMCGDYGEIKVGMRRAARTGGEDGKEGIEAKLVARKRRI